MRCKDCKYFGKKDVLKKESQNQYGDWTYRYHTIYLCYAAPTAIEIPENRIACALFSERSEKDK